MVYWNLPGARRCLVPGLFYRSLRLFTSIFNIFAIFAKDNGT